MSATKVRFLTHSLSLYIKDQKEITTENITRASKHIIRFLLRVNHQNRSQSKKSQSISINLIQLAHDIFFCSCIGGVNFALIYFSNSQFRANRAKNIDNSTLFSKQKFNLSFPMVQFKR